MRSAMPKVTQIQAFPTAKSQARRKHIARQKKELAEDRYHSTPTTDRQDRIMNRGLFDLDPASSKRAFR